MTRPSASAPQTVDSIHELVRSFGGKPDSLAGQMITELIQTSLRLLPDGHDTGLYTWQRLRELMQGRGD